MSNHSHRRNVSAAKAVFLCVMASIALLSILLYLFRSLALQPQPEPESNPAPTHSQVPSSPPPTAAPTPDFSQPVPESSPVDESFLDDAVFIGDSRTEGLLLYTGLTNATGYTHKGLMVDTVFTEPVIPQNGQLVSVMDAMQHTQFSKVYIMLGINELGWEYPNLFIETYKEILDQIRSINPTATIYVQEIFPVSQQVSDTHSYITNEKID